MGQGALLITDDDPDLLAVLKGRFEGRGYEVHTASDGNEAFAQLELRRPALVLLDIHMPRLDGLVVLREIKERYPDVCVIAISGDPNEKVARLMLAEGASDFILKPIDMRALENSVEVNLLVSAAAESELRRP